MADGLISFTPDADGKRRFTNADLARMVERGLFDPEDRWELIEGEWFDMPSEGDLHAYVRFQLQRAFMLSLGPEWFCGSEMSLFLDKETESRPDLAVFPMRTDISRVPGEEISLIVEIMDSSHRRDRTIKLPVYARQGIQEVWLIDLVSETIEIYERARGDDLSLTQTVERSSSVQWRGATTLSIKLEDLLP